MSESNATSSAVETGSQTVPPTQAVSIDNLTSHPMNRRSRDIRGGEFVIEPPIQIEGNSLGEFSFRPTGFGCQGQAIYTFVNGNVNIKWRTTGTILQFSGESPAGYTLKILSNPGNNTVTFKLRKV